MNVNLDLFRSKEVLATVGGFAASALIYALLIQPSIELNGQYDQALADKTQEEEKLAGLHSQFQMVQQNIQTHKRHLSEVGGSPPPAGAKDLQIARVTNLANSCDLQVDQYSPIDVWEKKEHQELFLRFSGRGTFESFQKFLQRLEAEIDFVDITHFAISLMVLDGPKICTFNWACRFNGMRKPEPIKAGAPQPAVSASGTQRGAT